PRRFSCSWCRPRSRTSSPGSRRARPNRRTSSTSGSATRRSSWPARRTTTTWSGTTPARSPGRPPASTRSSAPRRPPTRIGEPGSEPTQLMTADHSTAEARPEERVVAVAVDAAGAAGQRPFSYRVPASLADVAPGEAVLVEFGRRQALGIVLGPGEPIPGVELKPVLDRIRAEGPLLPALGMRLAAWISDHYLAPPAISLRAMLPPGLLERLELVAELRPEANGDALG